MLFSSWNFIAFFAIVYPIYLLLLGRHRLQNAFLLAASLIFYAAWDYRFLLLLAVSSGIDFFVAQFIHAESDQRRRKMLLTVSIVLNLLILGFFKYFNFFTDSFVSLLHAAGLNADPLTLRILLPIGISFYTFQAISYVIDVYRRDLEPTKSPVDYALFIAFFPHLVAGPIQRPIILLPQVIHPRSVTWNQINAGLFLIIWGYFKKVVIADNMALIANPIFDQYNTQSGADLIIGALAFTFQIYGDFSGYSDIARGLSKLMGFDLMVNFRLPYLATSPSDFWQRWHISLSTWLRDYLYIPLGGNRRSAPITYRNLFLTMLHGGLWHGAAWNFVLWGGYHGLLLVGYRFVGNRFRQWRGAIPTKTQTDIYEKAAPRTPAPPQPILLRTAQIALMFCFTAIGWILFRSTSFDQAIYIVTHLGLNDSETTERTAFHFLYFAAPLVLMQLGQYFTGDLLAPARWNPIAQGLFYGLILCAIAIFGVRESMEFIYFQF